MHQEEVHPGELQIFKTATWFIYKLLHLSRSGEDGQQYGHVGQEGEEADSCEDDQLLCLELQQVILTGDVDDIVNVITSIVIEDVIELFTAFVDNFKLDIQLILWHSRFRL